MLFKTQFIGRLGSDSEVRTLDNGEKLVAFNVAVDRSYKNKSGEKVEKAVWIRCTKWNIKESTLPNYLKKGQLVYVEGEVSARAYEKDGPQASLELKVDLLELLGGATANANTSAPAAESPKANNIAEEAKETAGDDLPF